jgi:AcrR family transcriptional regulator
MAQPFRSTASPPARRRAAFLTRDEIVAAAALILERDGYDSLNMRAVAAELAVQAAALYRHVGSRAELDDLLFDHLMADCAPKVRGKDWRDDLMRVARAWRKRLVSRRDATSIAFLKVSIGPNIAPLMEAMLAALRRSGLRDSDIVEVFEFCLLFVHGFASDEAIHRDPSFGPQGVPLHPPEWAEAYPTLSRLAPALTAPPDFEAHFAFGLDALIAGIERKLAVSR